MARVNSGESSELLLARLVAMITGEAAMPKTNLKTKAKGKRGKRPVVVDDRVAPKLTAEVYAANLQHAKDQTCCCGCGGAADSNSRGRTLKHYEQFRAAKSRAIDPIDFDHKWQARGLIFPPNFNPDKSYTDYAAEKDVEAQQREGQRKGVQS